MPTATRAPAVDALAVHELTGEAMGSRLQIIATGAAPAVKRIVDGAFEMVIDLEARWSRFQPNSEISRLNREAGSPLVVTEATLELIARAVEASSRTGGLFDPTMLRSLEAVGYDRTFITIDAGSLGLDAVPISPGCSGIEIDRCTRTVRLPADVAFDPGGLGKGLAADLVAERMLADGAAGALVNLGGDLRCVGTGPTGAGWAVRVGDTVAGVSQAIVDLAQGGVATSTSRRRQWDTAAGPAHHLIDPATGRPAVDAAESVTVIAATAGDAETLATALAVLGDVPANLHMLGDAAAIVHHADGRRSTVGPVDRFVR